MKINDLRPKNITGISQKYHKNITRFSRSDTLTKVKLRTGQCLKIHARWVTARDYPYIILSTFFWVDNHDVLKFGTAVFLLIFAGAPIVLDVAVQRLYDRAIPITFNAKKSTC